jgi:hypothetical protein
MKVLDSGAWKDATPRGVLDGGVWKAPKTVYVLSGGVWAQVWPGVTEEVPGYLYDVEIEYLPGYEVRFTALKGFMPDDPTDEAFMFRATPELAGINGYVTRTFTKKWSSMTTRNCTLADQYGNGTPDPEYLGKTISFTVQPRP